MAQDINVTIEGGFGINTVDSGNLGTKSGGTGVETFTVDNISTNQNLGISSVIVSVDGDPSFSSDYGFQVDEWELIWDDSEGHVDLDVTVDWADGNDPGNGNDVDLAYEVRA